MVLVLLLFENMTNTNTILAVGIVFQYNTSRIVHLCLKNPSSERIFRFCLSGTFSKCGQLEA